MREIIVDRENFVHPRSLAQGTWWEREDDPRSKKLRRIDLDKVDLVPWGEEKGIPLDAEILMTLITQKNLIPENWIKLLKDGQRIFFNGTKLNGIMGGGTGGGVYVLGLCFILGVIRMDYNDIEKYPCNFNCSNCWEKNAKKLSAVLIP